jgi:APA family basic amino acid/polyamine antiporter
MMILRRTRPDLTRIFRCPQPMLVGALAIVGCMYLFISLPALTIERFLYWNLAGLIIYLAFGRWRSRAAMLSGAPASGAE